MFLGISAKKGSIAFFTLKRNKVINVVRIPYNPCVASDTFHFNLSNIAQLNSGSGFNGHLFLSYKSKSPCSFARLIAFGAFLNVAPTCRIGGISTFFPARSSATVKSCTLGYFRPHVADS